MRVLIADDSKVILQRLTDLVEGVPGVRVVAQASDVPRAINSILEMKPDAVILDLQMPGGSGLDVLRIVRLRQPAIRVLVCTNYSYDQYREECINAGAYSFLDKSSDFEKIPEILRALSKERAKPPLIEE